MGGRSYVKDRNVSCHVSIHQKRLRRNRSDVDDSRGSFDIASSWSPILWARRTVDPIKTQALFVSWLFRRKWQMSAMAWTWFMFTLWKMLEMRRNWKAEQTKTLDRRSRSLMGSSENWTPRARTENKSASHCALISSYEKSPRFRWSRNSNREVLN